jgi:NAD-dependent DNA ligase (contains BRCT domain type II)
MQNNKEDINSKDEFSELVKQKLENYSVPVDEQCWAEIEQRLKPKRKKTPIGIWLSAASIAAGFALLFMLNPFANDPANMAEVIEGKGVKEVTEVIENTEATESTEVKEVKRGTGTKETAKSTESKKVVEIGETKIAENIKEGKEVTEVGEVITNNIAGTKNTENAITATEQLLVEEVQQSIEEKQEKSGKLTTLEEQKNQEEKNLPKKNRNQNKWTLAAAYGSSSGSSSSNNVPQSMFSEGSYQKLVKAENSFVPILSEEHFSDIQYLPPLSFGFNIRKDITPRLGLATGLHYTYLSTYFKNADPYRDAALQLHYLGIPLDVVFNLYDQQRWNIYLSGGVMVEQGLEVYKQNFDQYEQNYQTSKKPTIIEGVQWSANAAFGVSYEIYRNIGVYFQPRASYFFDNNQPISLRTKQPFTINLNIGLQYRF